jgi:hypothetical protein
LSLSISNSSGDDLCSLNISLIFDLKDFIPSMGFYDRSDADDGSVLVGSKNYWG